MKARRKFTTAFKAKVVQEMKAAGSAAPVAQKYKLSPALLYRWSKTAQLSSSAQLDQVNVQVNAVIDQLNARIDQLEEENAILRAAWRSTQLAGRG